MSVVAIVRKLPEEIQLTMMELVETMREEMREELVVRREDIDGIREDIGDLSQAQERTERQVGRLEIALLELAEAQKRTELRLEELAEAQKDTDKRVGRLEIAMAELSESQKLLGELFQQMVKRQDRMQITLDELVGDNLEHNYREHAHGYFGRYLRRVKVVPWLEIEPELENHLSDEELSDASLLDLLVRGRPHPQLDVPELWLAVEVSKVVDKNDVERARRRAMLLRKAGFTTIPVAAGKDSTVGAEALARESHVLLVQNGRQQFWDTALADALVRN